MTTTPSKPDLVALAERPSEILKCVLSGKTLRLRCGNHLIERNPATGHVEMTPAFARALLNELASQPSLYEAGLRDMRERARLTALAFNPVGKLKHRGTCDGIAAAISALPADGGEVGSDTTLPGTDNMDARFAWLEAKCADMGYVLVPEPEHPDSPHRLSPTLYDGPVIEKYCLVHCGDRCNCQRKNIQSGYSDYTPVKPGPSVATTPSAREALEEIRNMTVSLRSGGPDPMDLQELSDALERATELASELLNSGGF